MKLLALMPFITSACFSATYTYHFTSDKKTATIICQIDSGAGKTTMMLDWNIDTMHMIGTVVLNQKHEILTWKNVNVKKGNELNATRVNDSVRIVGIHKNKPMNKTYCLDGKPWFQLTPFDFSTFALSDQQSLELYTFVLMGPYAMKFVTMQLNRLGEETISVHGKPVPCIKIRFSPTGLFAKMWHGDYWFRKSDGVFVHSESAGMPGAPPSIMEIVSEK